MRKSKVYLVFLLLTAFCVCLTACSEVSVEMNIDSNNLGVDISDKMYGLFLEDISNAGDGGLISNLVDNGSFEYDYYPLAAWRLDNLNAEINSNCSMSEKNLKYLAINADGKGRISNLGFVEYYNYLTYKLNSEKMNTADMGFIKDATYELSLYLYQVNFSGTIKTMLDSPSNRELINIDIPESVGEWTKITMLLDSKATEDGGLTFEFEGNGTIYMDFVSLVPTSSYGYDSDLWKYVSLRPDLYQALVNLNPNFIRFPGGCLAEGDNFDNLFDWKNTIGPLEERKQTYNIWNKDHDEKYYNNTFALGYHEYFQLSEDLSSEPLPILNVGMICQFEAKYNANAKKYKKGKMTSEEWEAYLDTFALRPNTVAFDAYVQDIFDLIEYANGDIETEWGRKRAENGHPEPFNLKYIGLGNENWGEVYWRNFDAIYNAIKEKHPEIKIISSAGYQFADERVDESWSIINEKYTDTLVDEHYYTNSNTLFKNNDRYDHYVRNGVTVFVGEYAAESKGFGKFITKNNIWAAIEEASYMTAMERNGDIVKMAAYAPTFAKVNAHSWRINMIWFDSHDIILTPNYFNQMLFANNIGNKVVNTDYNDKNGIFSVTTVNQEEQAMYVKLINTNKKSVDISLDITGFGTINAANNQYLSDKSKAACNEPKSTTVVPKQKDCTISGDNVSTTVDGYSINVIRIFYGDNDGSNAFELPELPTNMHGEVTVYDKFYMTPEALGYTIILGTIGLIWFACAVAVIVLIKKKSKKYSSK